MKGSGESVAGFHNDISGGADDKLKLIKGDKLKNSKWR
jgi:hypothetical protein